MIQFIDGILAQISEEIHDWAVQYTIRKVPEGIVQYQTVMPQGIVQYQTVMPQGIVRYQTVMPKGIVRYQTVMPQGIVRYQTVMPHRSGMPQGIVGIRR